MTGLLYLLGFPTPVLELFLAGAALFLALAIAFGLRFTGLEAVDAVQDRADTGERSSTEEDARA